MAITNQALDDIPRSMEDCKQPRLLDGLEVYVEQEGRAAVRVPFLDYYETLRPISLSPTGKYALFDVLLRKVPPTGKEYEEPIIRAEAVARRNRVRSLGSANSCFWILPRVECGRFWTAPSI